MTKYSVFLHRNGLSYIVQSHEKEKGEIDKKKTVSFYCNNNVVVGTYNVERTERIKIPKQY